MDWRTEIERLEYELGRAVGIVFGVGAVFGFGVGILVWCPPVLAIVVGVIYCVVFCVGVYYVLGPFVAGRYERLKRVLLDGQD